MKIVHMNIWILLSYRNDNSCKARPQNKCDTDQEKLEILIYFSQENLFEWFTHLVRTQNIPKN